MIDHSELESRILILAPLDRDSILAANVLSASSMRASICTSMENLCQQFFEGAGAIVLTEEALTHSSFDLLKSALNRQKPWSDIPVVLLTSRGNEKRSVEILNMLGDKGNIYFVERTFRPITLVAVCRTALRSRGRQYEIRDLLEQLEQFNIAASHDLRAPLRNILMFSDLLEGKMKNGKPDDLKYLHYIRTSAEKMQDLMLDLQAYSVISHEPMALQLIDLNRTAAEALRDLKMQIEEKRARIRMGLLPFIFGNHTQMRRVFQNLIENSLKYTNGKSPEVRIESGAGDAKNVEIHIADNGIGFDAQYADKIFKPFHRLHGEKYSGTGMGLAICRKIVERHGGEITAHSRLNAGATFTLRLPLAR